MSSVAIANDIPGIGAESGSSPAEAESSSVVKSAVIGVFDAHAQAEQAISALQQGGFPLRHLSIVGKGYHTEEKPTGFYTTWDRVRSWGGAGLFWGSLWGLVLGTAFFWVPEFGPIGATGPMGHLLINALQGAVLVGGISALGAVLFSLGMRKEAVIKYARFIKADRYLVIAQGTSGELARAGELMERDKVGESAVVEA